MKTRKLVLTLEIESDLPLKEFKKIRQAAFGIEGCDTAAFFTVKVTQSQINVIKE